MTSICAVICMRNESTLARSVIEGLVEQDIDVAVIDNSSTDATRSRVEEYRGHGLVVLADLPFKGYFSMRDQLEAKVGVMDDLPHEWMIHHDADEIIEGRHEGQRLRDTIEEADRDGYDAINFEEFVFLPVEDRVVDIDRRRHEMRHYYFFAPSETRLVRAMKREHFPTIPKHMGHRLDPSRANIAPETHNLRHYLAFSQDHLRRKYLDRTFDPVEIAGGAHVERARLTREQLTLPSPGDLHRVDDPDTQHLDRSAPRSRHFWAWNQ